MEEQARKERKKKINITDSYLEWCVNITTEWYGCCGRVARPRRAGPLRWQLGSPFGWDCVGLGTEFCVAPGFLWGTGRLRRSLFLSAPCRDSSPALSAWKYPNLATIGRGLGAPGFFAPIRWTLSKQMFSTVSSGAQVCLDKVFNRSFWVLFGRFRDAWKHQVISHATGLEIDDSLFYFLFSSLRWVIFSVRDLTESRRDAYSAASVSTCCWLNSSDSSGI